MDADLTTRAEQWLAVSGPLEPRYGEAIDLIKKLLAALTEAQQAPPEEWRCFHCGETFTTVGSAQDHFGSEEMAEPGCLIDRVALEEGGKPERGRGLLMALRKAEADITQLRLDNDNLANDSRLYHELSSEVDRLTGGHGLRMELDYRNGEQLVLQEKLAAAETALTEVRRQQAQPSDVTAEQFKAEVEDKCGVIFNGAHNLPLNRAVARGQCERFLVDLFNQARAADRAELLALRAHLTETQQQVKP